MSTFIILYNWIFCSHKTSDLYTLGLFYRGGIINPTCIQISREASLHLSTVINLNYHKSYSEFLSVQMLSISLLQLKYFWFIGLFILFRNFHAH